MGGGWCWPAASLRGQCGNARGSRPPFRLVAWGMQRTKAAMTASQRPAAGPTLPKLMRAAADARATRWARLMPLDI